MSANKGLFVVRMIEWSADHDRRFRFARINLTRVKRVESEFTKRNRFCGTFATFPHIVVRFIIMIVEHLKIFYSLIIDAISGIDLN